MPHYYVVNLFGRLAVECLCFQKAKITNNGIMAEKKKKSGTEKIIQRIINDLKK
jgi:hypothetical protein